MRSRTTKRFRETYKVLPADVRRQARIAYRLFQQNPGHPSLNFERIHPTRPFYSVRITIYYRAIGRLEGDTITWAWIGGHAEYDRILRNL